MKPFIDIRLMKSRSKEFTLVEGVVQVNRLKYTHRRGVGNELEERRQH